MSGGSTLYTRPQTGASVVSVVQNKESSHFVSQMSSTEALGLINKERENINIDERAGSPGTVINVDDRVCCERWEGAWELDLSFHHALEELHRVPPPREH